jgi:hypothetical protein
MIKFFGRHLHSLKFTRLSKVSHYFLQFIECVNDVTNGFNSTIFAYG